MGGIPPMRMHGAAQQTQSAPRAGSPAHARTFMPAQDFGLVSRRFT